MEPAVEAVEAVEEAEAAEAPRRPRRADAGTHKISQRDLELLRFIGEQYAITQPQLARLIGHSEHAARRLRSRWQQAGWVLGRALLYGEPPYLWLTRSGLRLADLDYRVWEPSPGGLAHVAAVNEVRLWIEGRRPQATWISERELARDQERAPGTKHGHRPDALVLAEGQEVAVEVELALKTRERLERIVRSLIARYDSVWYFAAEAPRRTLSEIARQVGGERVQVLALPDNGGSGGRDRFSP